jgi:hypothetical protein
MRVFDMAPSHAKPYRVTLDDAERKRKFPALADHLTMGQPLRVEAETRIERIQLVAANVACGSKAYLAPNSADVGSAPHNGHELRKSNLIELRSSCAAGAYPLLWNADVPFHPDSGH